MKASICTADWSVLYTWHALIQQPDRGTKRVRVLESESVEPETNKDPKLYSAVSECVGVHSDSDLNESVCSGVAYKAQL